MGRKKQIDTSMYFCPYSDCSNHGKVGPDNQIIGAGCYGKHQAQLLKCKVCDRTFSERRGTPLFNLKASEETFHHIIACLVEGNGIRATARWTSYEYVSLVAESRHQATNGLRLRRSSSIHWLAAQGSLRYPSFSKSLTGLRALT